VSGDGKNRYIRFKNTPRKPGDGRGGFACESEKVVLSLERERILPNGEKNKASKEMSNAIDSLKESSILVTLRHQNSSPPYHYVVYAIEIRPKLWLTTKVTSGLHPEVSG
jgi:hypothetical protein